MMSFSPTFLEIIAAVLFAIAIVHTFSTKFFMRLAHLHPKHAGVWHLLGEVEAVFGFWALVLIATIVALAGKSEAIAYLEKCNFTEPMFVFVIMVIAASKPILYLVTSFVRITAKVLPFHTSQSTYFLCLSLIPLLGSFVTEPAAMTLAALLLRDGFFSNRLSNRLLYATLGVLFVNISIGGTLTSFAAPPVLMIAAKWQWDTAFMLANFGWKAAGAVIINAAAVTYIFRRELMDKGQLPIQKDSNDKMPAPVVIVHLLFLIGVIFSAHHQVVFMGLFLFFLGFTEAYKRYQDRLILREGLMVAFFLAGLVALGGLQQWWLQPTLSDVGPTTLYYLAMTLTAITDNAALTYLGSLVEGVSAEFKYSLVAGAVTGGGLTVIANAPNPAGFSILKGYFQDEVVSPLGLFLAALLPTCVAVIFFQVFSH